MKLALPRCGGSRLRSGQPFCTSERGPEEWVRLWHIPYSEHKSRTSCERISGARWEMTTVAPWVPWCLVVAVRMGMGEVADNCTEHSGYESEWGWDQGEQSRDTSPFMDPQGPLGCGRISIRAATHVTVALVVRRKKTCDLDEKMPAHCHNVMQTTSPLCKGLVLGGRGCNKARNCACIWCS